MRPGIKSLLAADRDGRRLAPGSRLISRRTVAVPRALTDRGVAARKQLDFLAFEGAEPPDPVQGDVR